MGLLKQFYRLPEEQRNQMEAVKTLEKTALEDALQGYIDVLSLPGEAAKDCYEQYLKPKNNQVRAERDTGFSIAVRGWCSGWPGDRVCRSVCSNVSFAGYTFPSCEFCALAREW